MFPLFYEPEKKHFFYVLYKIFNYQLVRVKAKTDYLIWKYYGKVMCELISDDFFFHFI